jgi:hypothetical protein
MSLLAVAFAVTIRIYDVYGLSPDQRREAQAAAAEAFAAAGVEPAWIDCGLTAPEPACATPMAPGDLVLRILRHPPDGVHVLGEAVVHRDPARNVVATVYAAAAADRARRVGLPLGLVVGRIAAHELGHLLLGSTRHSREGLMRPSWILDRPYPVDWRFAPDDAAAIARRLRQREPVAEEVSQVAVKSSGQ